MFASYWIQTIALCVLLTSNSCRVYNVDQRKNSPLSSFLFSTWFFTFFMYGHENRTISQIISSAQKDIEGKTIWYPSGAYWWSFALYIYLMTSRMVSENVMLRYHNNNFKILEPLPKTPYTNSFQPIRAIMINEKL